MFLAKILIIAKGLAICEVGGYMITCKIQQENMLILVINLLKEVISIMFVTCYHMNLPK